MSSPVLVTQAGYFQMSATHSFPPISTTVAGFCVGSGSARKYVTICVASLAGGGLEVKCTSGLRWAS